MKKLVVILSIILGGLLLTPKESEAISVAFFGKGGILIHPSGQYAVCPQFAFRICCIIEISFQDIWEWITENSTWKNGINTQLPINGSAVVYNDDGQEDGTYNVRITWLNPGSDIQVNGDEIIVGNSDMNIEVVQ